MIEVILDKSFINNFGNIHTEEGRSIDKILLNENNHFIINTSLLEYIEKHVSETYKYKWEDFFTYLSDNNHLSSSLSNTLDTNLIFDEEPKLSDYIIILKSNDAMSSNNNECNLKSASDVFFKDLLEKNQINLRSINFINNNEIKLFFKKLFYCSKTKQRIIIISRYNNFDCDIIEVLKEKFIKKTYWTTYKGDSDPSTNIRLLKNQLGNSILLFTGNNEQIHERKFILGNLIVEFDDDFNKITHDVSTWSCHCSVDINISNNLRSKQNSLRRIS